jgi:sugar/nucleoside kinase (ribokinase family)
VDAVEAQGVEAPGPRTGDRTGVVVSIVSPDGDRTMASDRGSARELEADELTEAWFADCDWLHVTAYAVMSSPIDVAVDRATAFARRHGAQVSLDLSAWTRIRDYGPSRFGERVERLAPDVVFGTEREWEVVDGHVRPPTMVTKRGARGVRVRAGGENRDLPAVEGPVVDSTGAGDAFAAGYLVGGVEAGLEAASRCVGKPGAMP